MKRKRGTGKKNLRVLAVLVLSAATMVGVAYAFVPLYALFCKATGYNGTTQRVAVAPAPSQKLNRIVTVTFDTNVAPNLPWDFKPEVRHVDVKLGEIRT